MMTRKIAKPDAQPKKKFETVRINKSIWMAENFSENVEGSWAIEGRPELGRLYTLEAAKKACPKGWHLPYKDDVLALQLIGPIISSRSPGEFLKAKNGWNSGFGRAIDNCEDIPLFEALPAGVRLKDGTFKFLGDVAAFWTSHRLTGPVHLFELVGCFCISGLFHLATIAYLKSSLDPSEDEIDGVALSVRYVKNKR